MTVQIKQWKDPQGRFEFVVEIVYGTVNGRIAPTALSIRSTDKQSASINPAIVRRIPISKFVMDHVNNLRQSLPGVETGKRPGPHRGRHLTADELQDVATVYREALLMRQSVQESVAEHFAISKSMAAKRIGLARAAGYLGPAIGRQPGEKTR